MNAEEKVSFDKNMFQQVSSSHSQFPTSSTSTNDQDELIARKKLEQKRRFQQKQTNAHKDVDSLMQSMFSDLKLQPKSNSEPIKTVQQISELSIPPSVNHQIQPVQTQIAVPGAADWSKITLDDEFKTVFNHDEKITNIPAINSEVQPSNFHHSIEQQQQSISTPAFVYPNWCTQPVVFLPLVYQQVYEATCISDVIQTTVLYPILLLSGLRQDQLSQIWSQVNLTQPGVLIKEELFMALALIALAQNSNGNIFPNEQLHYLTDIPIPHFQIQQQSSSSLSSSPPPPPSPPPVETSILPPVEISIPSTIEVETSIPPPSTLASAPALPAPIVFSAFVPSPSTMVSTSPPPPPPPEPVYQQEDFADFTSFDQIMQNTNINTNTNTNNNDNIDILLDFEENHLNPPLDIKAISSETQSLASLDLPIPTMNPNNQDDTSQKEISDNISFTSSNNNEIIPVTDTQSIHSINSTEPSKIELTQFSFFADDTSQLESHISIWLRCFEKCHSILSQANEIFSSIQSPILCTEILQQTRTKDYIQNLQEIFLVHKRIYTSAILEPTTTEQLTLLWKQIIVLWTNLQSFFSTAHLHSLNDDDIDYSTLIRDNTSSSYCSICLLSTVGLDTVLPSSSFSSLNTASIVFAGRLYHAPCANFYLNLIDGILPSLRRSS